MSRKNRTKEAPTGASLPPSGPLSNDPAPTSRNRSAPSGAYDLLGDRFSVRSRHRAVVLAMAGAAFVATAALGVQAVAVRADLRASERDERAALDQRAELSAELQELTGGGGFTQEQLEAHLAGRQAMANRIAGLDPAADQLLSYLAASLPAAITVTAVSVTAPEAAAKPAATTTTAPAESSDTTAPATTVPPAGPTTWAVTVTATAQDLQAVSTINQIMSAAPMLRDVSVSWIDGAAVTLTVTAQLVADETRPATVAAEFGGAS